MEQREVRYIKVRTWREEEEEENKAEGEEEKEEDHFYHSQKFAIGYNQLQTRWRSQLPPASSQEPPLISLSPQSHLPHQHPFQSSSPSTASLPIPQKHPFQSSSQSQDSRKKSLHLPLVSTHHLSASSTPSLSTSTYGDRSSSSTSRLSANISTSFLETPSPSSTSSTSSFLATPSSTSSTSSFLTTPSSSSSTSSSSPPSPSPDTPLREDVPLIDEDGVRERKGERERQGERERSNRLVSVLRQVLNEALTHAHLRRRRKHYTQHTTPHDQVAVLENELEAYRILSRAKKEAADLLKHELMAVLYERVMAQEEQDQVRRQLEGEITSLEYQLDLQRTAAHHHLATLSSQLDRALEEKQVLQQQLNPCQYLPCEPPPDAAVRMDVSAPGGCLARRRRSC